jgi:hypothetical protein
VQANVTIFLTKVVYPLITTVLLLGIAIAWIVILVPPMVRGRAPRTRRSSGVDFQTALGKLDATRSRSASVTPLRGVPTLPTAVRPGHSISGPLPLVAALAAPPETADEARRRRRDVIVALAGLATFTLLLAIVFGSLFVAVHLLVDVSLLGYVMAVAQRQRLADERTEKVTPLRPARRPVPAGSHDQLLRRSGT